MSLRAAYCDVDGTLTRTSIVTPLSWLIRNTSGSLAHSLWVASLAIRGPYWLLIDRFDREASNRAIYRQYRGLPADEIKDLGARCYSECIKPRLYPGAVQQLKEFKESGVKVVLVTGGLDFLMRPFADEIGAEYLAPGLLEENGVFTGELNQAPLTGRHKADAVRAHSQKYGVDLSQSYAMGDAMGDMAMLECVGHPIAVNADSRLARIADQNGWKREQFRSLSP